MDFLLLIIALLGGHVFADVAIWPDRPDLAWTAAYATTFAFLLAGHRWLLLSAPPGRASSLALRFMPVAVLVWSLAGMAAPFVWGAAMRAWLPPAVLDRVHAVAAILVCLPYLLWRWFSWAQVSVPSRGGWSVLADELAGVFRGRMVLWCGSVVFFWAVQDAAFAIPSLRHVVLGSVPAASLVAAGVTVLAGPYLLLLVMPTSPANTLLWAMDGLEGLVRAAGVRVYSIRVWQGRAGAMNAAVLGLIPGLRFVLVGRDLALCLEPDQLRGVMAHELAHARHHHLWWYVGAMVAAVVCEAGVNQAFPHGIPALAGAWGVSGMGMAVGAWLATFGWISRRFEAEADFVAVRLLTESGLSPVDALAAMQNALGRVAQLHGISATARSWTHGSIAARIDRIAARLASGAKSLPGLPARLVIVGLLAVGVVLLLWPYVRCVASTR